MTIKNITTFTINLPSEEIKQRLLDNDEVFESQETNQTDLKIVSNQSVGTLMSRAKVIGSIYINAKIRNLNENETEVTLSTQSRLNLKVAIALYIAVVLFSLFIKYIYDEKAPLLLIFIIPLIPFWFRFIYADQEKVLMQNVLKFLRHIERR